MPTSNAQRQLPTAPVTCKRDDGEGVRLNLIIGTHAKCALERLASAHGLTQRAARTPSRAGGAGHRSRGAPAPLRTDYYERRLRLPADAVTP